MTQTQQHCSSPDQLLTFLRGQLTSQEESELQLHLNDCESCRERLENAAADANAWNEAKQFFGNGALHASSEDSTSGHEEATQGSQRIRQVLDALGPTDDPESLGRIGGYEVTGVVGAGGMGVVLKAHDRSLDRIVAIKVMSPHLASSGSARKRFAREAKAAAAVLHPNVIAIHSVASEVASPYLVMPYVRGASLQKRIDSHGPLPLKDTLRIGAQIAAGLAAAHEQGLVHRDIKPANILLEEGVERVTITDFGLARAVDDASMTCSGVIAGTPQYMSPEQTRGEPIDARSDLFSLGSVLYAMCAGRSPFRAETTYGVLHRIANDSPTPVCEVNSDIPVWLGHIIERLMAKRPDDRFASAAQVAELLEGCLAHVQQPAAIPLPAIVEQLSQLLPAASPATWPPEKQLRQLFYNLPPIGKLIAAAAGAFALFFAGILIVLELSKGTLTIESELDDVPIRIMQGDKIVDRLTVTKSGNSVRVAAGTYVVELETKLDGMVVENDQVSLKRGATEQVKIRLSKTAIDANAGSSSQSLQGVWEFISVESDGVVREYKTLTTQLIITGDMWMAKTGGESSGSDLGSGDHRVRIDGNKLTLHGTITSPALGSSKEIPTIGYGFFEISGDSLVYLVTPAMAGGDFTGQSESPIRFPETFETKGTRNTVFRLRRVSDSTARDPDSSNRIRVSKSSPEFPLVKIVVHDEEGKPRSGVQVSLFQVATKEGGQILEINETSDAKGMAVNRNLPFGHYELSSKTADGWYLPGYGSRLNVEFEKGLDIILVAPTPNRIANLVISSELSSPSAMISELRFGKLQEVFGLGYSVPYAPEPVLNTRSNEPLATNGVAPSGTVASSGTASYESFPTITHGIEHVGAEIRIEIERNIPQPAPNVPHVNTTWKWNPTDNEKLVRRYLIANGQARGFVNGLAAEDKSLDRRTIEGSEFFKLPSHSYRVGASLLLLREPTALPLELEIPAGSVKVLIERFFGKPNAAVMAALDPRWQEKQPELWLEANIQRNSAWIERLLNTEGLTYSVPGDGVPTLSGIWYERSLEPGETLEISLGKQQDQKTLSAFEARTIDDVTAVYNEQTRQLRTELFNPPIPDLTKDQMQAAMLDAAQQYRRQGKVEFASALESTVKSSRMVDRITFMGSMGTAPANFRQIKPVFHFEVASNALESIVLRRAELRYSRNGWSSETWGDIHPPITGKWELVSVEERGETLTEDAFNEWRQKHAGWTQLVINEKSLTMAGDIAVAFDLAIDHDSGPLPQFRISQQGNTKFAGVLMGNGFVDDTTLVFAVDLKGRSKPKTFHTQDGKTTNLTYRRTRETEIPANTALKTDSSSGSKKPTVAQSTEEILKSLQGHPKATDRTKDAFKAATAVARKEGKPLNTLYLLAALMRRGSVPAIAEVAEQKKVSMKDLIERCDLAAQVADTTSAEQWQILAATADDTAKQWKHDYLGTEHLLLALMADGTVTNRFLSEQGIEAAAVRDMQMRIYFSPGREAQPVRPLPKK